MTDRARYSAVQLVRDYADVRRAATRSPVEITHHGKRDMVMLSHEDYDALVAAFAPRARFAHELDARMAARLREPFESNDESDAATGTGR